MSQFKMNPNFGKIPASNKATANRNIEKIAESSKTVDQKVTAIIKEFNNAYRGTGFNFDNADTRRQFKELLEKGTVPTVG